MTHLITFYMSDNILEQLVNYLISSGEGVYYTSTMGRLRGSTVYCVQSEPHTETGVCGVGEEGALRIPAP